MHIGVKDYWMLLKWIAKDLNFSHFSVAVRKRNLKLNKAHINLTELWTETYACEQWKCICSQKSEETDHLQIATFGRKETSLTTYSRLDLWPLGIFASSFPMTGSDLHGLRPTAALIFYLSWAILTALFSRIVREEVWKNEAVELEDYGWQWTSTLCKRPVCAPLKDRHVNFGPILD